MLLNFATVMKYGGVTIGWGDEECVGVWVLPFPTMCIQYGS